MLVDQLIGLATRHPVLFVLEGAHWVDPTTLELAELALDRIVPARVLMLINRSTDIQGLFVEACERVGVEVRPNNWFSLSVARRASVEILDELVGPKY